MPGLKAFRRAIEACVSVHSLNPHIYAVLPSATWHHFMNEGGLEMSSTRAPQKGHGNVKLKAKLFPMKNTLLSMHIMQNPQNVERSIMKKPHTDFKIFLRRNQFLF